MNATFCYIVKDGIAVHHFPAPLLIAVATGNLHLFS